MSDWVGNLNCCFSYVKLIYKFSRINIRAKGVQQGSILFAVQAVH